MPESPATTDDSSPPLLPSWLDESFLQQAYGEYLGEAVRIREFSVEPAVGKGENYASLMYRIKSTYATRQDASAQRTLNCIVKAPFESGYALHMLDQMDVFDKELIMYRMVLPRLRDLLHRHEIAVELVANTIHVSPATRAIVFEDLAVQGFRMPARDSGLDMGHAKRLLHKLAVFHAGCARLHELDATVFEQHFKHGMLNRQNRIFDDYYLTQLDALRERIAEWPGFEAYARKLAALRPHLLERGRRAFDAKPGHFHTLVHGDIWVNNTMYTYTDADANGSAAIRTQPDRTMLVDFQYCCWSSPTIDLHYFFNTSLREELRLHCQDELLQSYHTVLTSTLAALGFGGAVPTLHEFHVEFVQNSFYAFISSCLVQPVMLNQETDDADVAALLGSDARALRFKRTLYRNEKVQRIVRTLLPIFDRRGLLDS